MTCGLQREKVTFYFFTAAGEFQRKRATSTGIRCLIFFPVSATQTHLQDEEEGAVMLAEEMNVFPLMVSTSVNLGFSFALL